MALHDVLTAYQKGQMVIVCDDQSRENECDLVIAAEHATPAAINFMATHGKGLICTPLSLEKARRLNLPPMTPKNSDPHQTAFTISIDHVATTTGISAFERAKTIQALLDSKATAADFNRPGHVFPLTGHPGGLAKRRGHTEAALALSELCGLGDVAVICEIMNDDGTMARKKDLAELKALTGLPVVDISDLAVSLNGPQFKRMSEAKLPTSHGPFTIMTYENAEGTAHHVALVNRQETAKRPLVRVHSECLTGDAFGSLRCDCGEQLKAAEARIAAHGHGALIYLKQEGRGIGLVNKIKAYALQDAGADTVEANHQLGFEDDLRRYDVAADILKDLGFLDIDLLTNNPLKQISLEALGITIHSVPSIEQVPHKENLDYLQTKKDKMGHWLTLGGKK